MLRHAFEVWGCRRVELKTDALNERSRGAMEALGARFEGIHRKHMLVRAGENRDSAWYSILDDEWPAVERGCSTGSPGAADPGRAPVDPLGGAAGYSPGDDAVDRQPCLRHGVLDAGQPRRGREPRTADRRRPVRAALHERRRPRGGEAPREPEAALLSFPVRHRIIDDLLAAELSADPELRRSPVGSGFDSRPFRLHGRPLARGRRARPPCLQGVAAPRSRVRRGARARPHPLRRGVARVGARAPCDSRAGRGRARGSARVPERRRAPSGCSRR